MALRENAKSAGERYISKEGCWRIVRGKLNSVSALRASTLTKCEVLETEPPVCVVGWFTTALSLTMLLA
jgi:hypothetical protein